MAPWPPVVAVLASHVRLEEKLIFRALEARGCPLVHVNDRRLSVCLDGARPEWDVALNRALSATRRLEVSRLCEAWGVPVVNTSQVVATCDDKLATSLALLRRDVPIPPTAVALSPDGGRQAIEAVGYPAVVKPINGSWGRMLAKLNDPDAAEAVLHHRRALPSPAQGIVYAQRFVDKPGRDVRAVVIGDRVVAAMHRRSEHWVSNTALDAEPVACPITPRLEELSLRAAAAVGGGALAVDLLETAGGELLVNEVNSSMEFHGLVRATGADVAGRLVAHCLEVARSA
ncbi:MAG TPA: lysine biosynthesis protein LysX [Candidatus Dormibacteraeota bacterium]|jgi:[lysine-biosynthesis-protein LysW]--L-2-aminoadipate ligase